MNGIFNGNNVFIALRTAIFKDFSEGEHITLEFLGSQPLYRTVRDRMEFWHERLKPPVTTKVIGYANYQSSSPVPRYFSVAMINFPDHSQELNFEKFWHTTIKKSTEPIYAESELIRAYHPDEDAFNYDICDDIWLGYKLPSTGQLRWLPMHTRATPQDSKEEAPF